MANTLAKLAFQKAVDAGRIAPGNTLLADLTPEQREVVNDFAKAVDGDSVPDVSELMAAWLTHGFQPK